MKEIRLQGMYSHLVTIVDDEDFELVRKYRWGGSNGRARATVNGRGVLLHRFLLQPPADMVVDHLNHDPLDNRRSNLRVCTQRENCQNRYDSKKPHVSKRRRVGSICRAGGGYYRAVVRGRDIGRYPSKQAALTACRVASEQR